MEFTTLVSYVIAFFSLFTLNVFILLFLKHRNDYLKRPASSGRTPSVSIVMPAYNEGPYIAESIRCLFTLDYPADKLEIIVVDDGSTDDTARIAKSLEKGPIKLHVFRKENGGKGAAINYGLKKAGGEFIATMDADSYVTKGVLRELLPYFEDPDVMAVSPAVKIRPSGAWLKELQRVEYLMILFSRKLLSFIESVPVTPGPFSMFRASVFDKVGPFDEQNLVEDQEIALRIQSHNFKIRSSMAAEVYTEPPATMKDLLRQRVRWQRGGFRNYWKYRHMIKPEYGDFGMYSIPMQFATIGSFFILVALMLYTMLTTPYYVRYIWFEAFGMGVDLFTFMAVFVVLISTFFLYLAVKSFEGEKVKLRYFATFVAFYWYLMFGYNMLFLLKEVKREAFSW